MCGSRRVNQSGVLEQVTVFAPTPPVRTQSDCPRVSLGFSESFSRETQFRISVLAVAYFDPKQDPPECKFNKRLRVLPYALGVQ
jgi:hypothetical protein